MRRDYVKTGSVINTINGELRLTHYNGSIAYCDEYEFADYEDEGTDLRFTGERRLTLSEIAHIMKEVDGNNHKVIFEEG